MISLVNTLSCLADMHDFNDSNFIYQSKRGSDHVWCAANSYPHIFDITIPQDGFYLIVATQEFEKSYSGFCVAGIDKNGKVYGRVSRTSQNGGGGINLTRIAHFKKGDVVTLWAYSQIGNYTVGDIAIARLGGGGYSLVPKLIKALGVFHDKLSKHLKGTSRQNRQNIFNRYNRCTKYAKQYECPHQKGICELQRIQKSLFCLQFWNAYDYCRSTKGSDRRGIRKKLWNGLSIGNVSKRQGVHSQSSTELRSDESTNYKFCWKALGLWKKVMLLGGVL